MKRFIFYVEAFEWESLKEQKFHGFLECKDEAEAREEISIWAGDVLEVKRLELSEIEPKKWFHEKEIKGE